MKRLAHRIVVCTEREAEWFFQEMGGKVPEDGDAATRTAAATIDGWFKRIPSFHRGVLDFRYLERSWPTCIRREFGENASIAVRIECALHPAVGSTESLEAASVERLRELIRQADVARSRRVGRHADDFFSEPERILIRLSRRSYRHVDAAIRALGRVRGPGPCVLPPKEAP